MCVCVCVCVRACIVDVSHQVWRFPPSDAKVFPEFILPGLIKFPTDPEPCVQLAFASCLPPVCGGSAAHATPHSCMLRVRAHRTMPHHRVSCVSSSPSAADGSWTWCSNPRNSAPCNTHCKSSGGHRVYVVVLLWGNHAAHLHVFMHLCHASCTAWIVRLGPVQASLGSELPTVVSESMVVVDVEAAGDGTDGDAVSGGAPDGTDDASAATGDASDPSAALQRGSDGDGDGDATEESKGVANELPRERFASLTVKGSFDEALRHLQVRVDHCCCCCCCWWWWW